MANAFLGVEQSLSGRRWIARPASDTMVAELIRQHDLPEPLARALAGRGITPETAAGFLEPTLREHFPDPSSFLDMDRACAAILDAVEAHQQIHIFADYDVDGATSAALLTRWLRALDVEAPFYVPDRLTEGYGPSPLAFDRLKASGAELVVTLDCGAAATDAIAHATAIGLKVVVIDHHLMREAPPACEAVVNPNRPGCNSGQGHLAAAGVTLVMLAGLNREARRRGLFDGRPEPDIRQWLDLAALGAICDVTALTGFNRALTAQGLKVMSQWQNPGLAALLAASESKDTRANTTTAGFVLGPRINAGGRIGRADLGALLLTTDDPAIARQTAEALHELNARRRDIEAEVTETALAMLQSQPDLDARPVAVVAGEDWHPGVVGIVAGRLRERLRKATLVIGIDPVTGIGRGSGRSQPGVNLGAAVQAAFDEGLLLAGGGHAMAAGLSVRKERIDDLRDFLTQRLADAHASAMEADSLEIDALLEVDSASRALCEAFERLAPYGPGNPEPLFALTDVVSRDAVAMNGGHVRARLTGQNGRAIKAIAWRCADLPLGQALLSGAGGLSVVGRLKPDDWNGRKSVQFEVVDLHDPRWRPSAI